MEIVNLSPAFDASPFPPFRSAIDGGGEVRGFVIPGAAKYSRRETDELIE
jgi:aspartyl-tRNA synthetase